MGSLRVGDLHGGSGGTATAIKQSAFPGEYWLGPTGLDTNDGGPGSPFGTVDHLATIVGILRAHLIPGALPGNVYAPVGQLSVQGWSVWEGGPLDAQNGQASSIIRAAYAGADKYGDGLVLPGAGATLERLQILNTSPLGDCIVVTVGQGINLRQIVCYDSTLGGPGRDGIVAIGDQIDQFDVWQCAVKQAGRFGFAAYPTAAGASVNAFRIRGGFYRDCKLANIFLQGSLSGDAGPIGSYNARIADADVQTVGVANQVGIPILAVALTAGTTYQFTTLAQHGITTGDLVTLSGFTPAGYNVAGVAATVVDPYNFTVNVGSNPGVVTVEGVVVGAQVAYGQTTIWGFKGWLMENLYLETGDGAMHIPFIVVRQASGQAGAPASLQQATLHGWTRGMRYHGNGIAADFPANTGIWWDIDGGGDVDIDISAGSGSNVFTHSNPAVWVRAGAFGVRVYVLASLFNSSLYGGDVNNVMNGAGYGINGNQVIIV